MNYLIIGLIIISVFTVSFYLLWKIMKSTVSTHEKLNILRDKAKLAKTKEELETLWEELKEVSKECWHKSFSSKLTEVKTIIEIKYGMI